MPSTTIQDKPNIPAEMLKERRWVAWRYEERDGKQTKVPIDPETGEYASATDPRTWGTYAQAIRRAVKSGLAGVGFVLGDGWVGVDFDKFRDEDGYLSEPVPSAVRIFGTYAEVSPSKTGVKIIGRGQIPEGLKNRTGKDEAEREIEVYDSGRFFTVTGDKLDEAPATVREMPEEFEVFCRQFLDEEAPQAPTGSNCVPGSALSDAEVIQRIKASGQAEKFNRLMAGDTTGYSSASDADGALSFLLVFWTGGDPEQIERIMRLSRLGEGREQKWERHDYLSKLTIPSAINKHVSKGGDFYSPNGHGHCHGNNPNGYSSNGQGPDGKTKTDTPKVEGSAADRLVAYTLAEDVELFCDQSGAPHLLDGTEPTPLTSRVYKYLRRLMWKHEGKVVARDALQGAAGTLAAFASDSGRVRELHTRAAFVDDTLYYELGPGRYAVVSANGWHVAESVPVLFRRIPNLLELPEPERGGSLSDGEFMVNLKGDRDKRLFRAYTVLAPLPHISRPILLTTGAMGSGKTTANRYVKKLLDPTKPEMVRMDKRGEFLQKASHCFLVMLDNETRMPEWAADTICRLTTGEADSKRVLYSDDDDFIYDMMRALLINGINVPTDRTDFLDRSLTVELERVRKRDRVPESKLWEHFSTIRPKLLGAIFEGLSAALKELPDTHPDELPRLADWGRYATAYYKACGHSEQTFAADWSEVERAQNLAAYDGSPLAQVIIAFMHDRTEWKGNATTLYKELTRVADAKHLEVDRDPAWPRTGRTLWRGIRELVSVLDAADISAQRGRTREGSTIRLLKRCDDNVTING